MHHQRDATVRFSIQPPPYSIIMATTTRTQSKSPSEQRPTLHRLIESARWKQIHELFRLAYPRPYRPLPSHSAQNVRLYPPLSNPSKALRKHARESANVIRCQSLTRLAMTHNDQLRANAAPKAKSLRNKAIIVDVQFSLLDGPLRRSVSTTVLLRRLMRRVLSSKPAS